MPQVGFELTSPLFEGAKRAHAIHRAATVFCMKMDKVRKKDVIFN
jgi:hypothetical protein